MCLALSSMCELGCLGHFLEVSHTIMYCKMHMRVYAIGSTATCTANHSMPRANVLCISLCIALVCVCMYISTCTPQPDVPSLDPLPGTLQSRVKGQLLLDPTSDETYHEDGTVLMAMMPTANLVSDAVHNP